MIASSSPRRLANPARCRYWHGDQLGRPYELGRAVGGFLREMAAGQWDDDRLAGECGLDELAVRNLRAYLQDEREATGGVLPTDRQIVVERFRDELGDWRVCRALALRSPGARARGLWPSKPGSETGWASRCSASGATTASWCACPRPTSPRRSSVCSLDPDEIEELVVGRGRIVGAVRRPLPRERGPGPAPAPAPPGSRTPLWQQRQRAADLLAVASRYGSFPILLETYRECLRDVFDLPALVGLMERRSAPAGCGWSASTRASPSPFASSSGVQLRRQLHVRGRRAAGRAPGPGADPRPPACWPTCSAPRSCAT